jgi:homoserine kinase
MSTKEARAVLPPSLPYKDAVFNISRAAMLVNCFATAQFDPLRYAMQDRLHQQYRRSMFPFEPFIQTALEAGAHGAFLSGAGPTVLAIAGGVGIADAGSDTMSQFLAEAVSEAMLKEARNQSIPGTVHISPPSAVGVSSIGTAADGTILWYNEQSRDATAAA